MIWSKAGKVDLACEALHSLGEVSMEGHNYEQAIADFGDCLSKRIAALPAGSRSIAETHYWHGVALAHMNKWSEAEAALNKALDQIDMQKGTYVEEEFVSGKIPRVQAIEGALQHAK